MVDTVKNASKRTSKQTKKKPKSPGSIKPDRPTQHLELAMIHNRIAQFALDNPEADEYYFHTIAEGNELLIAMAAVMALQAKELDHDMANKYRYECERLKGIITAGTVFKYLAENNFFIHGLHLVGGTYEPIH